MASGGAEEDNGGIPLDIDNVHMLLQVEHEQIQKRTFTNWVNAQLAKRSPPLFVSDLFSDLKDGSRLLDLLEVTSGQSMKRQRGHGIFQQRANIETAINFLKKKSIKLVNINIPDIIDGRPSIILGLVWTIILRCHIEELASTLSFSSRHSSLDSLTSLDSWCGSPVPASPVPAGRTSPLHRRFRVSAKKALLMWVRDQCQSVGSSIRVKDFKSSWRSGEAFLAILCSLRPQLVDLSLVRTRSNKENLEKAFHLAERELHIPRLLEPQDVDVEDPDEKSIMTYVAQFLQYSNDMPAPDDHLQLFPQDQPSCFSPVNLPTHFFPAISVSPLHQVSPCEQAHEVTCWLQQAFKELTESWTATGNSSYTEKYQVLQRLTGSFAEQKRPVMTLLTTMRRSPELSGEQQALRAAWDQLEEELQRCNADLDLSLPPPLDSVVVWLLRAEAALTDEGGNVKDHADAAKRTRAQQDALKTLINEMSHHVQNLDDYHNMDASGSVIVPDEKFDEIKRRVTHVRVTAKYQGIKLEYQEYLHTVLDLLNRINAKIQTWKTPYKSNEAVLVLLQDWHETVERQGVLLILMDSLQNLKEKMNVYTSKAALGEKSQFVINEVKEAEIKAEFVKQAVMTVRGMMKRAASAWEIYNKCLSSLQTWLLQTTQAQTQSPAAGTQQDISEWTSCQAKLNEAGNWLIEVTEPATSQILAKQLSKVNMQWAECVKRSKFEVTSEPSGGPLCLQMVQSLTHEATLLLRQPLIMASVPLKKNIQKLQLLSKKMAEVDMSSQTDIQTTHTENLQQTLPQMLAEAERTCWELQRAASRLEGRLAELDHWSTDALDCYQHLKEQVHKGRSALTSTAKALMSRGLQLEKQVLTEGRDLLEFVAQVQKTSPLQHISTSAMQDRISEAISHCQENLGMFSSLGFQGHVSDSAHQTQRQPEAGLFVVARTKHLDHTANVKLQSHDPSHLESWPKIQEIKPQHETTIVIPCVEFHLAQPLAEPVPQFHSEDESKPLLFSESHQASSLGQNYQVLPSLTQSAATEGKENSSPSQTHKSKLRIRGQANTQQMNKPPPQPPVMVRGEVHSKAQSMARSRLEKARVHLQGRIQQAIKLFGGKEISESQLKKKERALKILQPVILEDFLGAVEGFGAFCSGNQLQDLMLLSDSVRKQWEDVCREMAAFVPNLRSKIREGTQSFSVVQSETHTNALHEAADHTDHDSLQQQQAIVDKPASVEEGAELLKELWETVTPSKSPCLATEQLKELDETQGTSDSDTVFPTHSRRQQLGGHTLLGVTSTTANAQPSDNLPQKQSGDCSQQDLSPVAGSVPLHGDTLPLRSQDAPTGKERKDQLTQHKGFNSGQNLKPALRAQEQKLKARLLHTAGNNQQAQTHIQAVVCGNTVETKQEAEWTVITEAVGPQQEEHSSEQEILERYRKSCLVFQSQLHENKQHLEEFVPEPAPISTLQKQNKQLQILKQKTEALWFEFELHHAHLSRTPHLLTRDDLNEVERSRKQLTLEWRGQQICLKNRMISLDLMESADAHMAAITQKLDGIIREPVDISSYNLADPHQQSDLKEMDNRLQSEMRKLSKQISEEERQQPKATSLHQALHNSVSHLKQLRQRLEKVQLAAQAVDRFLATVRDFKAEIPAPQANQDASRQRNEANWEQERRCWQTAMELRLRTAAEQADSVDNDLKAAGMTLTMDGAAVTCQEVVTSLYKHVVDVEKTLMRERESKDEISPVGKKQMQRNEELNPVDLHLQTKPGNDSLQQGAAQEQEHLLPSGMEERQKQNTNTKPQREEDHKAQICRSEVDVNDQRGRSSQVEKEREGKTSLVQRRAAFLGTVREIRAAAEHLGLREPTLPALQHRTRALIEMESRLAGLLSELRYIQEASSSGVYGVSQTSEVEEVWEETTKAVAERLENCRVLTELLKTFQSSRGELSATLQRAENTISEQTSYMGKDNLQRLYTKVQEAKAELNGLGDVIEEVRSVCRQLHSHLRHIPECTIIPFENEADALMDSWLDISERTESHLENLHLGLTLWDGVLQLGTEVESWAADKLAEFTQSPSFQSEDEMKTLQNEVVAQEKSVERFQQRVTEIQSLLQSADPPLELQLAETQMKKKIEQVKELGSEAEDVYRQMVAAKEQITARMAECFSALQKIEDSLVTLGGSDVAAVLAKLKGLCRQLQTQDEQAESLLEDLRVMTTIASPGSLQSLSEGEIRLQEKIRNSHKLFSEVEEQTQRNIQDLDRLQKECEHLEQWLKASEDKATKVEDVSVLQEEALEQRVRTELLCQLVLSLQSSNLQQSPLVEESSKLLEQYHNFHVDVQRRSRERQCTLSRDAEAFRALSKSTQSWVGDLRQLVESVLCENPVEQRLHRVQDELSAMADGEARLEELRAAGTGLSVRLCDGDDLKQEIQETIQKIEEQWKDVVQSVEPYYRILHTDPELTSSFLARRQEVGCRVKELQHQFGQLPTLFPWPGTSERRRTCLLARQLWGEYESLQLTLTGLAEQRRELAEQTNNAIWNESSWTELDNYCLSLMAELKDVCSRLEEGASNEEHFCQLLQDCHHKLTSLQERMSACQAEKENSTGLFTDVAALESLLQETTDVEKDILQLYTLKDSITDSSTVEARASISQQVSSLQNHKRALDSNIRKSFLQIIQQVKGEFACVQKELDENVGNQCESQDVSPDINQLKQQWCAAQDCDTRLTELSARVHTLQKVGESSNGQNRLPADVILAVDEVAKDIDSSRTSFLQRKQEFAVNTSNQVREVIMLLQQWSQRVQADPLSPSQATLDEGLCLQQSVRELLPEKGFLPNCLGKKALKKLKKKASDALNESTTALETLSKCLMSQGYGEVESDDKDSMHKTGAETSLLPRELMATPPPESPSSSTDGKETGGSDQNDTSIITKDPLFTELPTSTLGGSKAEADAKKMDETPISAEKVNISAIHSAESFVKTANIDALVPDQDTTAKIHDQPKISMKTNFKPKDDSGNICTDSSPQTNGHRELSGNNTVSITVSDSPHNLSKSLIAQPEKPELLQEDTTSILESERSDVTSFGSKPESESENLAQSEIFKGFSSTDAQEQERSSEDVNVPPKKVFTIVLDIDLPVYQLQGMQQRENDGGSSPHVLRCSQGADRSGAKLTGVSNTGLPGPTFPPVKQEEVTDSCHTEKNTMSSPLCTVESSVQTGRALTKSHIPASDNKQANTADTAENGSAEHVQMAEGDNTEDPNDPEKPESKHFEVSEGRDDTSLLKEENESKIPAAMEETKVTKGQPQRQEDMKPDRTAPGPSADLGAEETTGESPESCKHASTMQDILSEIQSLVERSNIINRSPHVDLNWYLKSSPGESDIRLFRTVQQVLACRYQPAKLDVTAMAKQLVEAEECRCCVQEQVATMKSSSAARDPNALKRAETQWSTALLDASATVQVKATQLDQVKQYHKQMKMTRAFLEVLAAEKEKMSLNALGSSAVQADKLHILLQTMEQKKTIMQELLHLSSQLSVHLSDAESSGALLAQLGDVQEEWRLLEGSIKRALHQATNTTSQSSHLLKEAEQLEAKLEALRQSNLQSNDSKSALELVCLTTDLKLYTQLYLHLQSQSEALVHFSLGQKEKDEIQHKLQGLGSLLNDTKRKLHPSAYSSGGISSIKINKQLQDLIIWAKQAENHISIGKKLALFPEVARTQIVDMKKFQTDILSQRSKIQTQVEEMKDFASDTEKDESDQVLKTIEDLYEAIADSLDHVLDTMKKHLQEREKLLSQLANVDAWLAETHATRDPCAHVENVFKADIQKLESELENHKLTIVEIQSQLKLVEEMAESFKDLAVELSSGESRYLVNRLSGLWTELDGLLAHERATSWELEELIHERTTSDIELSNIQASLKQISVDLAKHKFPFTQETLSAVANLKHVLLENQCEVQELQHCHKVKRSAMLCAIGELQDRCKALSLNAFEQEKYLHLRRQMEESRDIAKEQIQRVKDTKISLEERIRLCQTLLVELPLVKTQCQEAGDQLEAIAQELYPSDVNSERQNIHGTLETLLAWEHSVTDDIKNLEAELLKDLQFLSELPVITQLFRRTKAELEGAKPINPDEKAIDSALRRFWVMWRNMESGMRVLEALGQGEKNYLNNHKELYSLRDAAMKECHLQMEDLSHARESLKDYQWAAQGAISFLHNAEATFLSAPGGFLDCTEEHRQTQQALEQLEDGFQAHISHLVGLVPQQPCLSRIKVEELHISILSQLLAGRALLEAQAQLRLDSLQSCVIRQQSHMSCHEDIWKHLSGLEAELSEYAATQVTSYEQCVAQQKRAMLLKKDLHNLAGKIEELKAGCPMQGCGVGKDGEQGALWRRWVALRRSVGLLMAHAEQRQEEWKDITTSMEKSCSFLAGLQAEVLDSSNASFSQEKSQEFLAQAEMHQARLELEQQTLASLERRLEHALSISLFQGPISPGPFGKTLVKLQEEVRSLKERNLRVVAVARREEKERHQMQEEMGEVEKHMSTILPTMEACSNPSKRQELTKDLSTQKLKLKHIMDGIQRQYAVIPADVSKHLQKVQLTVQRAEEELMEENSSVQKLAGQVTELGSGLEKVKALLEQRSPNVNEAQKVIKRVWDELDSWHSHLMLLENEVQDLAEEQPDQAHLLMDKLTQPLQLHQDASQMAEYRTSFLSKIPTCLKEFEDIMYSATCWLDEAQSWLSAPCSFTTGRSLQNHANSLQLVLEDSERIRNTLHDFRPALAEISAVCDISMQEERLEHSDQQVHKMQRSILEPLDQLLQTVVVVETLEAELKTIEKNVPKIRTILSSMDNSSITLTEHLHNHQVILANVQSMRRTLEEIEKFKDELHLPPGAAESLLVFPQARLLLQPLEELEHLTQQQTSLLESKMEERTSKDLVPGETQQPNRSPQRHLIQEMSNSEEEDDDDDDDKSSHSSSSSDTLTCSIPEDPEETLIDLEPLTKVEKLKNLTHSFSSDMETRLLSVKPQCDTIGSGCKTGLLTMDSKAEVADSSRPKTLTAEPLITTTIPAAEDQSLTAATLNQHESPKHKTFNSDLQTKSPQAVEGTRLIPSRPIAPFTASREFIDLLEEGDEDLSLSGAPRPDLVQDTHSGSKEQSKVQTSQTSLTEESQQVQEPPRVQDSSAEHDENKKEQQRWSQLYTQISQKLASLKKVQEEYQTLVRSDDGRSDETVSEKELVPCGSASPVLQQTQDSISMLRHLVKSEDSSHPYVKEELYEAARRVLLCLNTLTDLLLTPGIASERDSQLKLLQLECLSTDLVTIAELLNKVESETKSTLMKEEPQAQLCLTCLQDCLCTVQLVYTSSSFKNQHQYFISQLCILDEFQLGRSEIFPSLKDPPSLEQCVLGRHLRESPGKKAKLQQASRCLLQGITRLLELGEECIRERQMSQVHNRSQLQVILCRPKKLLQILTSQLAFVHHLFQREPEILRCQEDERLQLEVKAKAFQQQALEQEVVFQRRLQAWTLWEDKCSQLSKLLDEFEAVISSGEPEGEDEEFVIQHRLNTCQQTLLQLEENKAALGLLLDQCKVLQAEPVIAASVRQAGGALELRWRSVFRRTEQEIQRCADFQDIRARFQADFASISNWLITANKHLKTWSDMANTSDLNQKQVHKNLIELLDFSMEVEANSVQKASVSRKATRLLHLKEADCPMLRAQISELEVKWSQLTSDLSKIQEQLHQRLLAEWPPVELMSDLEDWLRKLEVRLNQDKETVLSAKDSAQITKVLLHYEESKAAIVRGQHLLDFLCQSGPIAVGTDVQTLWSEQTTIAEKLGTLKVQWLNLQRELENQIHGAEQMHHTCADREKQLQHLRHWIEQQKKQLNQWKQPISQTLSRNTLLEWEGIEDKAKEVMAALQELKATLAYAEKEEEHLCDIAFSNQIESVCHTCENLSQQIKSLRPALQQTVEDWSRFDRDLREVTLLTSRVRCALQHQQVPLFSLKQAEGYRDFLLQLQGKTRNGEELWTAVEKSFQSVIKTFHGGAAQELSDHMEGEQKQWKDVVQELKDEEMKIRQTLSLWREYSPLSENCSLRLQNLWLQWEELTSSSRSPDQDTQVMVQSVEKLQEVAHDLQSSVGDVLEASKPLIGRLQPPAASLIQSETRLLSRDVVLLSQAMSGKKLSLQEDLKEQKMFHTCLQTLEKQTQNIHCKLKAGLKDKDSVKQVLMELTSLFPSLVDVREVNHYLSLTNQERDSLHMLSRKWTESMTRISDMNRALQTERSFQERCKILTHIKEKLTEEPVFKKPQSDSCLEEILTVHQRLQFEIITGHQLLQDLFCDAVKTMEKETGQKRSELIAQVTCLRESWFSAVALVGQHRSLAKDEFRQRRIYQHGLKLLWKLLRDVDPLLPPAGPALCTLQRVQSCVDDYQCVAEALDQHSTVYNQTLEAGKHLCKTTTDSECQSQMLLQLQDIKKAWKRTTSLLGRRRDLVNTTVQKWSQCQDGITNIMSDLDELKTRTTQQLPELREKEKLIQETELSLQHLASKLRELGTMKTDLSQYIAAGDSALLEQQLEQLHGQWEELCMKVSLRRQEIADHLNAWTIFNDKNKEFCDWLTQMENKVCHSGDLSIEEMVEKLKKDCMEEINLFSENKSHLKQLGEQLLLASDEAKQTQVHGSLQEVNQRWHNLFHHIEARVKKLKETLVTVQQLDKNMSNLRSWLSRIEAELSRPITYSVCHHQEIQRRLAEQQELQRDIEQHTEGVASVLNLCDVLLRDEDAAGGTEAESDSLHETSSSLDQRWRTICAMALDRRLRIEETWRLWCKFLDDYSRFEDWLKMAERTAANPNSADVLYTVAKEELKKFEGFQRQVHERLTQLELVNNQYRRLARENRTDRASQLKAMVHEGNRRWDALHRRVAAILRRLKYFTSQREEFEGTRESMLVWLTELDLQLTNVEHFSESDVHHKIQQLNSFQKEITLNTERIDGLIVFGESLIQKSSPQDAALIEDELEELHTYCQEVFSRLVRFHQRLSQPPMITKEPELSSTTFSLESSLELIGRLRLGRSQGSLPATPIHLLTSPLERSGRETPVSVDSLPLEWDHTGDVGGSSSHEDDDDDDEKEHEEDGSYFSALSVPSGSMVLHDSSGWASPADTEMHTERDTHTSTPLKHGYLHLMSQCSGSIEDIKRVSLILDDEEQQQELGLTGLTASDKQSGVIERWELLQAQSMSDLRSDPLEPGQLTSDLDNITSWLENVIPELDRLQLSNPATSIEDMEARAKELKEMQKMFTHYKSIMLSVNLRAQEAAELQDRLTSMNRDWSRASTGLQQWDNSLRKTLMRCQEFHETLHSLLLWLAHAESRRYAVDISRSDTSVRALQQHRNTLTELQDELQGRQTQQASLQALWSQLQPEDGAEDSDEAREKLYVTGSKLRLLLKEVDQDLSCLQQRLDCESATELQEQNATAEPTHSKKTSSAQGERRDLSPPRSFFYRVLRAAFPLHLLLLLLLLIPCLIPLSESDTSCTVTNNFARSFYPMLHYTNGPPPT